MKYRSQHHKLCSYWSYVHQLSYPGGGSALYPIYLFTLRIPRCLGPWSTMFFRSLDLFDRGTRPWTWRLASNNEVPWSFHAAPSQAAWRGSGFGVLGRGALENPGWIGHWLLFGDWKMWCFLFNVLGIYMFVFGNMCYCSISCKIVDPTDERRYCQVETAKDLRSWMKTPW